MKRETREVPNQFARQHNDYVSEETARAGTFNIRNVSEDVIGTYWRREQLTDTQKDAARIFQSNYQTPKLVGSYGQTIHGEQDMDAERMADHHRACKMLGPLSDIVIEVCLFNKHAGKVHKKGIDLLRFALDSLVRHYGLTDRASKRTIETMSRRI